MLKKIMKWMGYEKIGSYQNPKPLNPHKEDIQIHQFFEKRTMEVKKIVDPTKYPPIRIEALKMDLYQALLQDLVQSGAIRINIYDQRNSKSVMAFKDIEVVAEIDICIKKDIPERTFIPSNLQERRR